MTSQDAVALAAVRARALLSEHHQPLVMTPGDVRALLARYQAQLQALADACEPYAAMRQDPDPDAGG